MKWFMLIAALLVVSSIAGVIYVRTATHDPDRWHVDPLEASNVDTLNEYLGSATVSADAATVAAVLPDLLGGQVLAGDFASGWVTVVVRTPLVGYPDYVSVRIVEQGAQSSEVTIFSRSRFGKSDLGANKSRVEKTFDALRKKLTVS